MALFVRRLQRVMSNKKYGKKGQSSKKNPFEERKCFECGEPGHIAVNCPNKKSDKYGNMHGNSGGFTVKCRHTAETGGFLKTVF